jgi:hypothetical protein
MAKRYFLSILECTQHKFKAISIQEDDGPMTCGSGYRVTGSKCCGCWDKHTNFFLSPSAWKELSKRSTAISDELEAEPGNERNDE